MLERMLFNIFALGLFLFLFFRMIQKNDTNYIYVLVLQALGISIGFFALLMNIKLPTILIIITYIFSIVILALVLVIGTKLNGARRWIFITKTLSFQPSEIVKFLMILLYAAVLTRDKDELGNFWKGWVKHLAYLIPIIVLLLLEPHLSSSIVIIGICTIMMILAGCKLYEIIVPGTIVGIPALIYIVYKLPHALKRITTFLDPWEDELGKGWQVIQSLYAIGSGGLFGAGLGQSKQKYLYLPEPQNDFIFSVIAEELGFIGCVMVIVLFAVLIWRGILVAMKAPDMFGGLMAVGITTLITIQVIVNIAVVTSSMPATGMPLPFFSYGGTALFILLCEMRSHAEYFKSRKHKRIEFDR